MKKNARLIMLISLLIPTFVYSAVGENNLSINVGGGLNYQLRYANETLNTADDGIPTVDPTRLPFFERRFENLGGGFNLSMGHLYLKEINSIIHAADTRVSYGMSFSPTLTVAGRGIQATDNLLGETTNRESRTMQFSVGTTYSLGQRLGNGRYLVDIAGLGFGFIGRNERTVTREGEFTTIDNSSRTLHALVDFTLPGGFQYIYDNGFSLGFRHNLAFAFSYSNGNYRDGNTTITGSPTFGTGQTGIYGAAPDQNTFLSYNLTFSLGYVWGK